MKKKFLLKTGLFSMFRTALAVALTVVSVAGNAQIFNAASQPELTFPGPAFVNATTHSFTYTMSHIMYMSNNPLYPPPPGPPYMPGFPGPSDPLSDLIVNAWDAPGSTPGISYLNIPSSSGILVPTYDQGVVPYPSGVRDLEVSLMQDEMGVSMFIYGTNAPWFVLVSYYNPAGPGGPGHYMDVYNWVPAMFGGGLTWISTTQLSSIPNYTRISMDAHNTYGFCITWENPGVGIQFVNGFMNPSISGPSISPVYTLAGTKGETKPDVSITHSTMSGLEFQFVYYHQSGPNVFITESSTPMQFGPPWVPAGPAIITPTVRDVNVVPYTLSGPPDLKTRMDAPDHWTTDWAYTYVLPNLNMMSINEIFVRYMSSGVPSTQCITNGSMGNLPCDVDPSGVSHQNDWAVPSFDYPNTNIVNIEWYTQYQNPASIPPGFFLPNVGGYIGMQMDISTGGLTSTTDYLQVADPGSNKLASTTPAISSSKQNDRTDYQFVMFANSVSVGSPVTEIQDKERLWGLLAFKGAAPPDPSAFYKHIPGNGSEVTAYPNPFADIVVLNIPASLMDKNITLSVQDLTGRVMGHGEAQGSDINTLLGSISEKLDDGIYLLKVTSGSDLNKVIKIQKMKGK